MNEVLRQERKFLISLEEMYRESGLLSQVLMEDPHNRGDGYTIRSLYFDSLDDRDLQEKEDGVELRRKIRLRCYDPRGDFAVLEMKQKQGAMQLKRSLRLTRGDAGRLTRGDYSPLTLYSDPFAAECYGVMRMLQYQPRAVIEYRRRAFMARENKIRITFDHHITGTESCYDIFSPELLQSPLLNPCLVVLEVKYNGFLLSYIKDLLERHRGSELSVSKYALGRAVSKHVVF